MSDSNNDNLFKLINALTQSEKRYFSIYAARHTVGTQNNSVRMFKKLEVLKVYDEKKFLEKNKGEAFTKHYRFNKHFLNKLILPMTYLTVAACNRKWPSSQSAPI